MAAAVAKSRDTPDSIMGTIMSRLVGHSLKFTISTVARIMTPKLKEKEKRKPRGQPAIQFCTWPALQAHYDPGIHSLPCPQRGVVGEFVQLFVSLKSDLPHSVGTLPTRTETAAQINPIINHGYRITNC